MLHASFMIIQRKQGVHRKISNIRSQSRIISEYYIEEWRLMHPLIKFLGFSPMQLSDWNRKEQANS